MFHAKTLDYINTSHKTVFSHPHITNQLLYPLYFVRFATKEISRRAKGDIALVTRVETMKEKASRKLSKMIEKWRIRRKSEGHFVVYTKEGKKYTLALHYLNHPIFRVLLEMAEEEFGLTVDGPLRVPCDKDFLNYVISIVDKDPPEDVEKALLSALTCRGGASSSAVSVLDPSLMNNDQGGSHHHQAMLLSSCS